MSKIETRLLKREIAEHLMEKNCFSKCDFLYFKENTDEKYRITYTYDAIVMLNNYKLEKLLIITCGDDISINEIPLTIEYDEREYSEIKLNS